MESRVYFFFPSKKSFLNKHMTVNFIKVSYKTLRNDLGNTLLTN